MSGTLISFLLNVAGQVIGGGILLALEYLFKHHYHRKH